MSLLLAVHQYEHLIITYALCLDEMPNGHASLLSATPPCQQVVGQGFHPKAGMPHAEVYALRAAGKLADHRNSESQACQRGNE
jgi:hypothetical protein